MRMLLKNQQPLKYALQIAEIPEFEYYEDEDGNKYPVGIIPNGKTEVVYGEPQNFFASISQSGGEAEAVEYGLSTESFEAVLILEKGSVPLKEGALIWYTSEPTFEHIEVDMEVDGKSITLNGDYPQKTSSDFQVVKVSNSLNFMKVILTAINK